MTTLDHWRLTWNALGVTSADVALYHAIIAAYDEPSRRYHTRRHLQECFDKLGPVQGEAEHLAEIEIALWFHDAVYDVRRTDNEARSAEWARTACAAATLSPDTIERVVALILATRHDARPVTHDAQILVDVDLSILGATRERFDEYERAIREEYAWVPLFIYRRTRRGILQAFRDRPRLFSTDYFFRAYEPQARENLDRSIAALA